jgi:tetratricopeptide (TPR) repeat protein
LVFFHAGQLDPSERELMGREMGMGLTLEARWVPVSPLKVHLAEMAIDLLDQAVARWADDVVALRYKAQALALANRQAEGVHLFDSVLQKVPSYENALDERVIIALNSEVRESGFAPSQRAVEINPWCSVFRERLAYYQLEAGNWDEALRESAAALRLDPFLINARKFLTLCYLHRKDDALARAEFKTLIVLHPAESDSLRRWLGHQRAMLEQKNPTGRGG